MTTPPKMIVVEMGEDYDEKLKQYDLTNTRVVPMPKTGLKSLLTETTSSPAKR